MKRTRALCNALWACLLAATMAYATPTPTGLTVIRGAGGASYVTLSWTAPPGTTTHKVYRTTSLPVVLSPANLLATPPSSTYQDPLGATPPYYYAVTANDGSGESGLSNEVGYVAIEALGGGGGGYSSVFTMFGVPFVNWDILSGSPQYGTVSSGRDDIIVDQSVAGTVASADKIVATQGGASCYRRSSDNAWQGTLLNLLRDDVFYYENKGSRPTRTIIIAGEVSNSNALYSSTVAVPAPVSPQPSAVTWYSWPDSRTLPINQLELYSSGINTGLTASAADLILSLGPVDAGAFAFCDPAGVWNGTLTQVVPGQAYMIVNQGPNTWNYSYTYSLTN